MHDYRFSTSQHLPDPDCRSKRLEQARLLPRHICGYLRLRMRRHVRWAIKREQSRKNLFPRPVVAALLTLHSVISNLLLCKRAATTDTAKCFMSRGGLNVNYATTEYGLYHRVKERNFMA